MKINGPRPVVWRAMKVDVIVLKKFLIVLGLVLVLVVGGVFVAPSFIDWNARVPEIAAQVKRATGRDLAVDGRLELRILPAPMLTARGVSFGNVADGAADDMVDLEAIEIRIALLPLLSGDVQVERIRLVKPRIVIEKYADGRTNLQFDAQPATDGGAVSMPLDGQADGQETTPGGGAAMGVRLDHFEIVDGTVIYHDVAQDTRERVENLSATLRATSLDGPFDAVGEVRVRGVPLSFEASLGEMIARRTMTINARINAPGGTRADIQGAALGLDSVPRFKGRVNVEGRDLAGLVDAVMGGETAPGVLARDFALGTDLTATAAEVGMDELEFRLGDNRLSGGIDAAWGGGVTFNVDLDAKRVDLDALLGGDAARALGARQGAAQAGGGAVAPAPPANAERQTASQAGFTLPKGVAGRVNLVVDALTYREGLMSDVRLDAELADGELTLSQFRLQAPGVTDVALFGFVRPQDGQPRFNGDLEITTADPLGLADWLDVAVPAGVADRVKRVALKTALTADQELVTFSNLDLTGDRTRVTGGVTVALRARPSFGADLAIDSLNLDTYLNGGNGSAKAAAAASAQETSSPSASSSTGKAMEMAGVWAKFSALNDFDANLKLSLGDLTVGGRTIRKLALDGTLYGGALELRRLAVGDVLGARADLTGTFAGFGGVPELTGVRLDAHVKDANALASALDVVGLPPEIGAVDLTANADGSLLKPDLAATVDALGGSFGGRGTLSLTVLPPGFAYQGTVTATHADARKLAARLGYTPKGPLGALALKAGVRTDGQSHDITDIDAKVGKTAITGTIGANTQGAVPNVTADLTTGVLNVEAFLAEPQQTSRRDAPTPPPAYAGAGRHPLLVLASAGTPVEVAQAGRQVDPRWSREAFDLSALEAFNGELTLKSEAIQFGDYRLDAADVHAIVRDGVLTADRINGRLFGGPVAGTAVVRANGTPTIKSAFNLNAVEVAQAVQAVAGKDLAAGLLDIDVNFAANGTSAADLVASLSGKGALDIRDLNVKQTGTGTALAPVIGLVAAMNQFALPQGGKPKAGLADLSAAFALENGVADITKLALDSAFGQGTGSGRVDLAGWAINLTGNITVEPNLLTSLLSQGRIGKQEVPFALTGRLDQPGVKLAVTPAQPSGGENQPKDPVRSLMERLVPGAQKTQPAPEPQPRTQPKSQPAPESGDGTLAPPPPPQSGTQQPDGQAPSGDGARPMTPEDMIKQLMQGL